MEQGRRADSIICGAAMVLQRRYLTSMTSVVEVLCGARVVVARQWHRPCLFLRATAKSYIWGCRY